MFQLVLWIYWTMLSFAKWRDMCYMWPVHSDNSYIFRGSCQVMPCKWRACISVLLKKRIIWQTTRRQLSLCIFERLKISQKSLSLLNNWVPAHEHNSYVRPLVAVNLLHHTQTRYASFTYQPVHGTSCKTSHKQDVIAKLCASKAWTAK